MQAGPKTKKVHVEKSAKPSVEGKKRSQPITRPIQEIEDSDLEVTDEEELEGGQLAEDDVLMDEAPESGEAPTKDPNGAYSLSE